MNNYQKKKNPEQVRQRILDAAATLVLEKGMAGLTLDAAAQMAGVSKGGLIHHFPSKAELMIGLFGYILGMYEEEVKKALVQDTQGGARFTRAYVMAVAALQNADKSKHFMGLLSLILSAEPVLVERWHGWIAEGLVRNGENPDDVTGRLIRYAADGVWLELCVAPELGTASRAQTLERLLHMTLLPAEPAV